MDKETLNKMPKWSNQRNLKEYGDKYGLILSDDIDSLFSCIILNKLFGTKVGAFYSFNKMYINKNITKNRKPIGVDADFIHKRCYGNHVTLLSNGDIKNDKCVNLNNIFNINSNNYTKKYAGSTLLTIISMYNYPIKNLTEEAKMILWCIDVAYKGYFYNNYIIKKTHKDYFTKILELEDMYNVLERHSEQEFKDIIDKYKLYKNISINQNGNLETEIDLKSLSKIFNLNLMLPKREFKLNKAYIQECKNIKYIPKNKKYIQDNLKENEYIFSLALTYTNSIKYTISKKINVC